MAPSKKTRITVQLVTCRVKQCSLDRESAGLPLFGVSGPIPTKEPHSLLPPGPRPKAFGQDSNLTDPEIKIQFDFLKFCFPKGNSHSTWILFLTSHKKCHLLPVMCHEAVCGVTKG